MQYTAAQRTSAVVEVIHQYLQLDREVHVVHGGAQRHVEHLGREVEQRVHPGSHQEVAHLLGGTGRHAEHAHGGVDHRLVDGTHQVAADFGAHDGWVRVVEGHQLGAANEEMGRVHEGPAQVAQAHHHHVVVQVVAQRVANALAQDT